MLRDIRELHDDPEAHAEELKRRWTGLLGYRYIGRSHSSMNTGLQHVVLETAAADIAAAVVGTDRRQMRSWHDGDRRVAVMRTHARGEGGNHRRRAATVMSR